VDAALDGPLDAPVDAAVVSALRDALCDLQRRSVPRLEALQGLCAEAVRALLARSSLRVEAAGFPPGPPGLLAAVRFSPFGFLFDEDEGGGGGKVDGNGKAGDVGQVVRLACGDWAMLYPAQDPPSKGEDEEEEVEEENDAGQGVPVLPPHVRSFFAHLCLPLSALTTQERYRLLLALFLACFERSVQLLARARQVLADAAALGVEAPAPRRGAAEAATTATGLDVAGAFAEGQELATEAAGLSAGQQSLFLQQRAARLRDPRFRGFVDAQAAEELRRGSQQQPQPRGASGRPRGGKAGRPKSAPLIRRMRAAIRKL
jgi:hypothetical protein